MTEKVQWRWLVSKDWGSIDEGPFDDGWANSLDEARDAALKAAADHVLVETPEKIAEGYDPSRGERGWSEFYDILPAMGVDDDGPDMFIHVALYEIPVPVL